MSLTRLIYASRMAKGVDPAKLANILESSKRNNEEMAVTGVLCYGPAGFLQALEGPSDSVNELYRRIVRDSRNEKPTLLRFSEITKRDFSTWSMAYIRSDEIDGPVLEKYSGKKQFDPFSMSAEQARSFLGHVSAQRKTFLMEHAKQA